MEWLLAIIAGVAVLWLGYQIGFSTRRTSVHETVASQWTAEQANAAYQESYGIVYAQMADPIGSGIEFKVSLEHVERATAAMNRLMKLGGEEHGPAFRLRFRAQFVKSVKADVEKWSRRDPFASDV
jgi:hypothetical protein